MIKPVVFENLDQHLVGILHTPIDVKSKDKSPGIVMLHGFTGNKAESHRLFVQAARKLCANGYNVLRFDFRGSGDSDGEFEDMTVQGEINDAKTAFSFLMKQKTVDKSMVGVLGLSLGGRVASILAAEYKRARFIVLYSPALGPLRKHFEQDLGEEKLQKILSGESVEYSGGWYLKKGFLESIDDPVPLEIIDRIKAPVLIVHGDMDKRYDLFGSSKKAYRLVRSLNDKNELYVVKGGDHTFQKRQHTFEVIDKTLQWINSITKQTTTKN